MAGSPQYRSKAPRLIPNDLEPGHRVGEYVVDKKLGEGGFGSVYRAVHPVIGKKAAVKVLHSHFSSHAEVVSRFVSEARAVNQIRHRNIIDIFSFGALDDGRHYYVMELLEGVPLDVYLAEAGALPVHEALVILSGIAKALDATHAAGLAHRDLKPENVFLETDDEGLVVPKILDFGIAKLLSSSPQPPIHKTRTGAPMGSPRYMSPEQCQGLKVDHRTDIYAFGIIAYRMLTGFLPFDARTALELMVMHVEAKPPPPSSLRPELPSELDEPLLRMIAKEPSARPASLSDATAQLQEAIVKADSGAEAAVLVNSLPASSLLRSITETRRTQEIALANDGKVTPLVGEPPVWPDVPPRGRRGHWVAAALVLLVGLGLGSMVTVWHADEPAVATPELLAASAGVPAASSVEPRPAVSELPPAAHSIALTIRSEPAGAQVFLGDQALGTAPGPVYLPRSQSPQTLTFKAPGHASSSVEVRPLHDDVLEVKLPPVRSAAPAPTKPRVPKDLEYPF